MKISLLVALTVLSPFWLSHSAIAMSRCESALLPTKSGNNPEAIASSIRAIARLKMTMDLAQAAGNSSATSLKMLSSRYLEKYAELVEGTRDQYTETKIKELIYEQILDLQQIRKVEASQEVQARDEVLPQRHPVKYALESKIELPDYFYESQYVAAADSVVGRDQQGNLNLLNLKKKTSKVLAENVQSYDVSADGTEITMLSSTHRLKTYSFLTKKMVTVKMNNLSKEMESETIVHQSGNVATMVANGNELKMYNKDDQVLGQTHAKVNAAIKKFRFINDHQIVFTRYNEEKVYVWDVNLDVIHERESPYLVQDIQLTPERDKIVFLAAEGISVMAISSMDFIVDLPIAGDQVLALLGQDRILVRSSKSIGKQNEVIYSFLDPTKPYSEHTYNRDMNSIVSSAVDVQGDRAFISTSGNSGAPAVLEIWKKVFLK
jgi:hypothetical protein